MTPLDRWLWPPSPGQPRTSAQDFGLLGGELLVGQDPLVVQPGELGKLVNLHAAQSGRWGRGLLLGGLGVQRLLFLFLLDLRLLLRSLVLGVLLVRVVHRAGNDGPSDNRPASHSCVS